MKGNVQCRTDLEISNDRQSSKLRVDAPNILISYHLQQQQQSTGASALDHNNLVVAFEANIISILFDLHLRDKRRMDFFYQNTDLKEGIPLHRLLAAIMHFIMCGRIGGDHAFVINTPSDSIIYLSCCSLT